jgi:hypothetical protein
MKTKPNDADVISVMISGGERVCDEAISKWWSGKYTDDQDVIWENIAQWKANRARVRQLAKVLKDALKNS